MGNRFGISGLGSESVRGRRDVDSGDSERTRPIEDLSPELGTYIISLSRPSCPEQEVSHPKVKDLEIPKAEVSASHIITSGNLAIASPALHLAYSASMYQRAGLLPLIVSYHFSQVC